MTRLEKFYSLSNHAWYKKQFAKLSHEDIEFCEKWIEAHDRLDKIGYAKANNRMVLGVKMHEMPRAKKSKFLICVELCAVAND